MLGDDATTKEEKRVEKARRSRARRREKRSFRSQDRAMNRKGIPDRLKIFKSEMGKESLRMDLLSKIKADLIRMLEELEALKQPNNKVAKQE